MGTLGSGVGTSWRSVVATVAAVAAVAAVAGPQLQIPLSCDSDQKRASNASEIALAGTKQCRLGLLRYSFISVHCTCTDRWQLRQQLVGSQSMTDTDCGCALRLAQGTEFSLLYGRSRLHNRNIEMHSFRSWQ